MSDFKLFLKQWHNQLRLQGTGNTGINQRRQSNPIDSASDLKSSVRFPHLKLLLDSHFGINEDVPTKVDMQRHRMQHRTLGKSQFSSNGRRSNFQPATTIPVIETRYEKQLRKARTCFSEANYFKAVCCYHKVSH